MFISSICNWYWRGQYKQILYCKKNLGWGPYLFLKFYCSYDLFLLSWTVSSLFVLSIRYLSSFLLVSCNKGRNLYLHSSGDFISCIHNKSGYEWVIQILVKAKPQSRKLSIINPPDQPPLLAAMAGPGQGWCRVVRESVTGPDPRPVSSHWRDLWRTQRPENTHHNTRWGVKAQSR